jgi:hypothetical protein
MTQAGVTRGGWSVKDILAHLVEWQQMNIRWYEAGLRGETPELPAPGVSWREIPRLNAMIYRKHRRRSLRSILDDYRTSHQQIVAMVTPLQDRDLVTPGRFAWTGPSWTLSDYVRANTAAHYLWARTRIRRWHTTQKSTGRGARSPEQPVPTA